MSRDVYRLSWALAAVCAPASPASAQKIVFEAELPRTLVFIVEKGDGGVATRDMTDFLRQLEFPLVDPALAHTAAGRDLVQKALGGDEGAAVQLGRDFGAHLLVLGKSDWGANKDPVDQSAVTATAEVEVRAIRLDKGKVIANARGAGRKLEATEQAARTGAIRQATKTVLEGTAFLGQIMNNWSDEPWAAADYFKPDPGSLGAALAKAAAPAPAGGSAAGVAGPRLAILNTGVAPAAATAGLASRGIGVIKKGAAAPNVVNDIEIEGVVVGPVTSVEVEGVKAEVGALDAALAKRLGITGDASRFVARAALPVSRDTVRVVARGPGGGRTEAVAAPRVDQRWAVIIGVGNYKADNIPDLAYANADAQSVYDFLRSSAAGPFPDDHMLFLKDEKASAQAMREALFVFLQKADWDDLVLIYFAGHGAPDPGRPENLYLLPHDADMKALAATGFPMWDVKTALRRQISSERVIVIADACHSGGTQEGMDNPISGSFTDLFTPSRRLTLTAADAKELSFEDARWGGGHGVFTHSLLEGLKGPADADKNGIVTFSELADFVSKKVRAETGGKQNPQRNGMGDVPLAVVGGQ